MGPWKTRETKTLLGDPGLSSGGLKPGRVDDPGLNEMGTRACSV